MGINTSLDDVLSHAINWQAEGHGVDLVTVVKTFGSSPRPTGTLAIIRHDGLMVGSVSGGCVEKQLVERIRTSQNTPNVTYQISEDEAKRHGLMCGGSIELVFETLGAHSKMRELRERVNQKRSTVRSLNIKTGCVTLYDADTNDGFSYDGETVHNIIGATHRILLIGANELARFTTEFAQAVNFDVTVIEPRKEFRDSWPLDTPSPQDCMPDDGVKQCTLHERCGVLALTHDPNLDDLALLEALELPLFYIGAIGSRNSHEKRKLRLQGLGATSQKLSRIHSPIGVDIGSRTSSEIAISIVAELIQTRTEYLLQA